MGQPELFTLRPGLRIYVARAIETPRQVEWLLAIATTASGLSPHNGEDRRKPKPSCPAVSWFDVGWDAGSLGGDPRLSWIIAWIPLSRLSGLILVELGLERATTRRARLRLRLVGETAAEGEAPAQEAL